MLHTAPWLFSGPAVAGLGVMVLIATLMAEGLARVAVLDAPIAAGRRGSHVIPFLRHTDLPNYWLSYDDRDVFEVVRAHNLVGFLAFIIFNGTFVTGAFGCFAVFSTMHLGFRALERNTWPLRWVWVVPALAMLLDMVEDCGLVAAVVAYPVSSPRAVAVAAACSRAKFLLWAVMIVIWAALALKAVVAPPAKHRDD